MNGGHHHMGGIFLSGKHRLDVAVALGPDLVVAAPPVGPNFRSGLDRVADERNQAARRAVCNAAQSDAPEPFGLQHLHGNGNDGLPFGLPTADILFVVANVGLIDLYAAVPTKNSIRPSQAANAACEVAGAGNGVTAWLVTPKGNGEEQIGQAFGAPRQSSTLPGGSSQERFLYYQGCSPGNATVIPKRTVVCGATGEFSR